MVNVQFIVAAEIAGHVPRHRCKRFLMLHKPLGNDNHYVAEAYYMNCHAIDYEDCICDNENDHTDDGCPTTGWMWLRENYDRDEQYSPVESEVVAFAEMPDAEAAMKDMLGAPW